MVKPSLPKGMRDYLPEEMQKRHFLIETIRETFEKFNYKPVQTPAMENLATLTEKYGEEGDQLLFRVLRSGDFVQKANQQDWNAQNSRKLAAQIADKGLRYDLTVPLARLVAMHRHQLQFPFKRYQVQPVWRADRPQKGRYREFYQFDGDVIGSGSLIHDAEMVLIFKDAFQSLGLEKVDIHINNRKVLTALAEAVGMENHFQSFCAILDKVDKIGVDEVLKELKNEGLNDASLEKTGNFLQCTGSNEEILDEVARLLPESDYAEKGLSEVREVLSLAGDDHSECRALFSPSLARGLDYYTGTIYEVTHREAEMGSIGGGGRYDDLTGTFGLKDMPGIGISFGVERIYDIMEEMKLFPKEKTGIVRILAANFGGETEHYTFKITNDLRKKGLNVDMYPESAKLKKQFNYADKAGYSHVLVIGEDEKQSGRFQLKNLATGEQNQVSPDELHSQSQYLKPSS